MSLIVLDAPLINEEFDQVSWLVSLFAEAHQASVFAGRPGDRGELQDELLCGS